MPRGRQYPPVGSLSRLRRSSIFWESIAMMMWILRGLFGVLVIGTAAFVASTLARLPEGGLWIGMVAFVMVLGAGALVIATDVLIRRKEITTISAIYFGLLLGLLLGTLFANALSPLMEDYLRRTELLQAVRLLITIIFCYGVTSTLLQTKDEFRFIIPYVEFSKQVKGNRPLVLDTSVIIDGRIADICDTRIIDSKLIVPRFGVPELQAIADSSDT